MANIKKGTKVRYTGESNWAYTKGETYEVVGYDKEVGAYGVTSNDDGEAYCVSDEFLEVVE